MTIDDASLSLHTVAASYTFENEQHKRPKLTIHKAVTNNIIRYTLNSAHKASNKKTDRPELNRVRMSKIILCFPAECG